MELGPEYESGAAFLTSVEKKKKSWLELILEDPVSLVRRADTAGGKPRSASTLAKRNNEKSNESSNSRRAVQPSDPKVDERRDDSSDDVEAPPKVDSETPQKSRRRWSPFGSPPEKLPESADSDAKQMNSGATGRARLR